MRARLAALVLLGALLSQLACATGVKPWERDVLARPEMAFDPDALETSHRNHIYFSKEGSMPGGAGGGGGCGCN